MDTKKRKRLALIVALTSIGLAQTQSSVLSPCLADIYASFPEASDFLKSFIVTGASIVSIPFIFLTGKLGEKISKKTLIIVGMIIMLVGALGIVFAQSMEMFAVYRVILYIGNSMVSVLTFSIMFESFPDGKDSAKVMGSFQACMVLVMAICPTIAGVICTTSWRAAQLINMVGVVPLALIMLFVPNVKPGTIKADEEQTDVQSVNYRAKTDVPRMILTMIEAFFVIMFGFVAIYYIGIYIAERGLGSSALTGTVASAMTIIGFPFNLIFAKIFGKFQRYTGIIFATLSGIAMIALGFNVSVIMVYILSMLVGIGCAAKSSTYPILVNEYSATDKITMNQSVYNVVMYGSSALCGYVPNILAALTGGSMQKTFMYAGIILLVYSIAAILTIKLYINKKAV